MNKKFEDLENVHENSDNPGYGSIDKELHELERQFTSFLIQKINDFLINIYFRLH